MQLKTVMILLVAFQLKHFLADYPLQTPYMLRKFLPGLDFVMPLLAHTGVHALFTFAISLYYASAPMALGLAMFDLVVHFTMDRIKASPEVLGRFKPLFGKDFMEAKALADDPRFDERRIEGRKLLKSNTLFWWSLGFDQMVHHLTHYAIIYFIVRGI